MHNSALCSYQAMLEEELVLRGYLMIRAVSEIFELTFMYRPVGDACKDILARISRKHFVCELDVATGKKSSVQIFPRSCLVSTSEDDLTNKCKHSLLSIYSFFSHYIMQSIGTKKTKCTHLSCKSCKYSNSRNTFVGMVTPQQYNYGFTT